MSLISERAPQLRENIGANAYGFVATMGSQLCTVPVLLATWTTRFYGEWLILTAVPSYLALADVGLSTAIANEMVMENAGGDKLKVQRLASTQVKFWLWATVALIPTVVIGSVGVNWAHTLSLTEISAIDANVVVLCLGFYAILTLWGGVFYAHYRCEDKNADFILFQNHFRILEQIVLCIVAVAHATAAGCAVSLLLTRLVSSAYFASKCLKFKECRLSAVNGRLAELKNMIGPSMASLSFIAGNMISGQGILLALNATVGPTGVAAFSPVRTLTRIIAQIGNIVKHGLWPEISHLFGADSMSDVWRLARLGSRSFLILATAAILALTSVGPWFTIHWTSGKVVPTRAFVFAMAMGAAVNGLWNINMGILQAINRHREGALVYLIGTGCAVGSVFYTSKWGLVGVGYGVALSELLVLAWSLVRLQKIASIRR